MTRRIPVRDLPRWLAGHPGILALALLWLTSIWGALLSVQSRPLGVVADQGVVTFELAAVGEASLPPRASCADAKRGLAEIRYPTLGDELAAAKACCLEPVLVEQLRLDFVFIPLYTGALLALLAARQRRLWLAPTTSRLRRLLPIGRVALGGAVVAGVCDVLENLALLRALGASPSVALPWSPRYAQAKFLLLLLVLVDLAVAWVATRIAARRSVQRNGAAAAES